MRRRFFIPAVTLAAILTTLVIVVVGGLVWLGSGAGRDFVLRTAVQSAQDSGMMVTLEGAEGSLLGELTIAGISVADADGRWLRAERLTLRWHPWQLLRGRLHVAAVSAETVDVARPPNLPPQPPSDTASGMPSIPLGIELDRLAVANLTLGDALLGRRVAISILAHGLLAHQEATLALDVRRLDAGGSLKLDAGYDFSRDAFDLDVQADEPEGIVAGLMGIPASPALHVRLTGEGPLSQWRGEFEALLDDQAWIAIDAAVDGREVQTVTLDGRIATKPFAERLPAELAPFIGDTLTLATKLVIDPATIRAEALNLDVAALAVGMTGAYGRQTGEWEGRLGLLRLAPDLAQHWGVALEEPNLVLEGRGQGSRMSATLNFVADRLAAYGMTMENLETDVELVGQGAAAPRRITARAGGDVTEAPGGGSVDLTGPLTLSVEAIVDDAAVTVLRDLSLTIGPATLRGEGRSDGERAEGELSLYVPEIAALVPAAGDGSIGPARLSADLRYAKAEGLALDAVIQTPPGEVTARAEIDAPFARVDAAIAGKGLNLGPIGALIGTPLAGQLGIDVTIAGPLAAPTAGVAADLRNAAIDGTALPPLDLRADIAAAAGTTRGELTLTAHPPQGATRLRTQFVLAEEALALNGLTLDGPGIAGGGQIRLVLDQAIATGQLKLDAKDIGPLLASAGLRGGGRAQATIGLAARDGAQHAEVKLDVASVTILREQAELARVGRANLTAAGTVGAGQPISARLTADTIAAGGAAIGRLAVKARGPAEKLAFEIELSAPAYQDLQLALSGMLQAEAGGQTIRLARGSGRVIGKPFTIRPGLTATIQPDAYRVSGLHVQGAGIGQASADLELKGGVIAATLDLQRVPMALLDRSDAGPGWRGHIDLGAAVSGTLERPSGRVTLAAAGVGLPGEQTGVPTADAVLEVVVDDAAAALQFRATGLSEVPLAATARVGRLPAGLGFASDSPLSAHLSWNGSIEDILRLTPLVGQQAFGQIVADLTFAGTLGAPVAAGNVTMTNASVEDYMSGIALNIPKLEIAGDNNRILLRPFEATDLSGGKIAGRAQADIATAGFPFSARLDLAQARVLNRDDIMAVVSGSLTAGGTIDDAQVEGRFKSEQIEINIDTGLPPSVTTVAFEEVGPIPDHGAIDRASSAGKTTPAGPGAEVRLDVSLEMPGRVFVRGRGLDSEWQGEVAVSGSAREPRVSGQLQSRRGQFDMIGKIFELQSSAINLAPQAEGGVEAGLGIKAVHEARTITVTVAISGTAEKPVIELSSVPALPQDEILSRLLFDKSRAALSPIEALQLANGLRTLSGSGGPDPIAALRRTLGVDVLRVDSGSGAASAPSLAAGKYVTDKVYVGVRQGIETGSSALAVEVEVLDNVSVSSEARQDGGNSIGLKYKLDY